jgi:protein farnesyltransferase/geranylgeranyltransferase type-1 subunit alpha
MPYSTQAAFVEVYVVDAVDEDADRVFDLDNPPPSEGAQLPCPAAIEFMADIHEARGKEGITEAVKVRPFLMSVPYSLVSCVCHCHQLWRSLAHTHDTIRKRYVVNFAASPPIE